MNSTGYAHCMPFDLIENGQKVPYYLMYSQDTGEQAWYRINDDGRGATELLQEQAPRGPNFTNFTPFIMNDMSYYLMYSTVTGNQVWYQISSDGQGATELLFEQAPRGPNFTNFMPFMMNGVCYYLMYSSVTGNQVWYQIKPGGAGATELQFEQASRGPNYTAFMPYLLNGTNYYLMYSTSTGNQVWSQINPDAKSATEIVFEQSPRGWNYTHLMAFLLNGKDYYLMYSANSGNQVWYRIYDKGAGAMELWLAQSPYGPGFTSFVPFTLLNSPRYFVYSQTTGEQFWYSLQREDSVDVQIRAYPVPPSVVAGDTLHLKVSCPCPQFRVSLFRQGKTLEYVYQSSWLHGQSGSPLPNCNCDDPHYVSSACSDWNWPNYEFPISDSWRSGAYVALFEGKRTDGSTVPAPSALFGPHCTDRIAHFVVRNPNPGQSARILYKLPLATYHAYNKTGNASLYNPYNDGAGPAGNGLVCGPKVTMHRPGGGTGGDVDNQKSSYYDFLTVQQTFAHWDAKFIRWLEENGYEVDYCTDLDIHLNPNGFLSRYKLLLSVGHDEYWSQEMLDNVMNFVRGGGNVAFFSGNLLFRRISFDNNNTSIICNKNAAGSYLYKDVDNPLTGITANTYYHDEYTPGLGYIVENADSPHGWIFDGAGLSNGDLFGQDEGVVGYEADAHKGGSNASGFIILGKTNPPGLATMGINPIGLGLVFTAATTDWPRTVYQNVKIAQITKNILNRLGS